MSIRKFGTDTGTVTSSPPGIVCGSDCTEVYAEATVVSMGASPDSGFFFAGFGGDSDCADGIVTMNADRQCDATFVETMPGNIVVEKQTTPNGRAETFYFSGEVSGSISDGQQLTRNGLLPGAYTVTETDHSLFDLTSIVCDDGGSSTPSTVDLATLTATFQVDPGETVTCTFTNNFSTCSVGPPNDLILSSQTVNTTKTEQACSSISAGAGFPGSGPYTVGPTGDVTFESLRVILGNAFTAQGDFSVILNLP